MHDACETGVAGVWLKHVVSLQAVHEGIQSCTCRPRISRQDYVRLDIFFLQYAKSRHWHEHRRKLRGFDSKTDMPKLAVVIGRGDYIVLLPTFLDIVLPSVTPVTPPSQVTEPCLSSHSVRRQQQP